MCIPCCCSTFRRCSIRANGISRTWCRRSKTCRTSSTTTIIRARRSRREGGPRNGARRMTVRDDQVRSVTQRRPRLGPRLSQVNINIWRLLVFVLIIAVWWLVAVLVGQNFFPTPWQTAVAAVQVIGDGSVPRAALDSIGVFLAGYLLSAAFAIPFGLLMGGIRIF